MMKFLTFVTTCLLLVGTCLAQAPGWWPQDVQNAYNMACYNGSIVGQYQANTLATTKFFASEAEDDVWDWMDFWENHFGVFGCEECDWHTVYDIYDEYVEDANDNWDAGETAETAGIGMMSSASDWMAYGQFLVDESDPIPWYLVKATFNNASADYTLAYTHFQTANSCYNLAKTGYINACNAWQLYWYTMHIA